MAATAGWVGSPFTSSTTSGSIVTNPDAWMRMTPNDTWNDYFQFVNVPQNSDNPIGFEAYPAIEIVAAEYEIRIGPTSDGDYLLFNTASGNLYSTPVSGRIAISWLPVDTASLPLNTPVVAEVKRTSPSGAVTTVGRAKVVVQPSA